MTSLLSFSFFLLFMFFLHCRKTSAQAPPASGPPNITAILEKGGQFTMFIRLLESTQQDDQINTQLNNTNQGLTVFAPADNAFSSLKSGTINSLSDQEKVRLVQFHVLPTLMTMSQFQTASNPLRTQAGNSDAGEYPLNVTTAGNQVNLTTGVDDATVANSVFSSANLAVYQVDKVLLPLDIFGTSASPAPAPSKPEKELPADTPKGSSADATKVDTSAAALSLNHRALTVVSLGVTIFAAVAFRP
ncbi:fasciclin-like arabinogalactan protein 11 [Mangifera indica]|uniref:fasciclin-like arabinogalactan protein 11 n=1 Tax=Mangifera indica TaxID=29780 RepID=UPI001CFB5A51|nr:fasciclin-like arabinogalactan protein 11 [Mangifera indica]